jgi:serine/threonine protein kinase
VNGAGWTLTILGVIAASAALIAAGLAVGRLGILGGIFGAHLARCFKQIGREFVHFIGAMAVALLLLPIALARMVLLKPAAAREALQSSGRELRNAFIALYALLVVQPLRLLGLRAVLSYIESRLPAAMTGTDATLDHQNGSPRSARAEFVGYTVLRELQRGGSGARLYVCEPDARTRIKIGIADGYVVIKSFDFDDGTRLAEILRESRSLDAARKLGLVLDHDSSERRFHYVMRYYEGLDLGKFTRRLHETAGADGLDRERLVMVTALVRDLVATLRDWHAAGLWHKDVKPENVIVLDGRATLIDLGLVTPLASQMTLTTHGTEYFRDPELVREALRGARVSEVDAARFDIYGAGAVLHFVLEGTFPAHGVLSGFRKPSPESLRWIARRAMADFQRRYASAEEMLRDLDSAIAGGDPSAVRPADLPSMAQQRADDAQIEHIAAISAAAEAAPLSPPISPPPSFPLPSSPPPPPDSRTNERLRIRVTDWWRGTYEMVSVRPLPAAIPAQQKRGIGPPLAVLVAALFALAVIAVIWAWLGASIAT